MREERGTVILSFVLILPVLLLLAMSSFDVFFIIQKKQHMASVSKEMGSLVYRSCPPTLSSSDLNTCIDNSTAEIHQFVSQFPKVLQTGRFIIQVWDVDTNTQILGTYNVGSVTSKYNSTRIESLNSFNSVFRKHLVTVEFEYDYRPIILNNSIGLLYHSVIF